MSIKVKGGPCAPRNYRLNKTKWCWWENLGSITKRKTELPASAADSEFTYILRHTESVLGFSRETDNWR